MTRCSLESIPLAGKIPAANIGKTMKAHGMRIKPTRKRLTQGQTSLSILDKKYTKITITRPSGDKEKGWLSVNVDENGLYFYLAYKTGRAYWIISERTLPEIKLRIALCDENQELRLNGFKIHFERLADYNQVSAALRVFKELSS